MAPYVGVILDLCPAICRNIKLFCPAAKVSIVTNKVCSGVIRIIFIFAELVVSL